MLQRASLLQPQALLDRLDHTVKWWSSLPAAYHSTPLIAESKLLLVVITDRDGEKGICHISNCMLSWFVNVLICSNLVKRCNHIWNNSYNCSHHLVKFKKTHCPSPQSISLLHRPDRQAEMRCGENHHPCLFSVLDGGTNLHNVSRNVVLLLVYYFPSKRQFKWSPFGLSHLNSPHCTGEGTVMILSAAKYVYANCKSRTEEICSQWAHYYMDRSRNSIDHLIWPP